MDWPTAEILTNVCPPAGGYRYEVLRTETMAELIVALSDWLVGFVPGYDREEISPGVVKRVVEAAYAKCLAQSEAILYPDVSNMTSTVRNLYEVMYAKPPVPSAT